MGFPCKRCFDFADLGEQGIQAGGSAGAQCGDFRGRIGLGVGKRFSVKSAPSGGGGWSDRGFGTVRDMVCTDGPGDPSHAAWRPVPRCLETPRLLH